MLICGVVGAANGQAHELPPGDPESEFVDEDYFASLATGSRQLIARAPAVVSVIPAADMKAMGARTLDEALESVPGLHVSLSSLRLTPVYSLRGMHQDNNPEVLVLMDGVPINNLLWGNRGIRSALPVNSIARVEVVRGPGSALYGADAFSGVINVITKRSTDVDGAHLGLRTGSFDSQDAWLLFGRDVHDWDVFLSLEWSHTNGDRSRVIASDAQTLIDPALSYAPGPLDTRKERVDTHFKVAHRGWRFHFWNWRMRDIGLGPGVTQALDPTGRGDVNHYLMDLLNEHSLASGDLDVTTRLTYLDYSWRLENTMFPPGVTLPIGPDGNVTSPTCLPACAVQFPDGLIGNPAGYEDHVMFNVNLLYHGVERHRMRLYTGVSYASFRPEEVKNFGPGIQVGTLTDVTGTPYIYVTEEQRRNTFLALQDEWWPRNDFSLTAGARVDRYNDFGTTVNPRLAAIWQTRPELTTKLFFGRAFRAPAFAELYLINNPVAVGNRDLKPAINNTTELVFDCHPDPGIHGVLSLFKTHVSDLFILDQGNAQVVNRGHQDAYGFELEVNWDVTRTLDVRGNYAWHRARDASGNDPGKAPRQQLYIVTDWRFLSDWRANMVNDWVMDRMRAPGDPRPPIHDYTLTNLTLRYQPDRYHWELALAVKNVFDVDAREPSLYGGPLGTPVPGDYPLEHRGIFTEWRYEL